MQLEDDDVIEKSEDLLTKMLTREAKLEHDKCCAPARKMSQARTCPSRNPSHGFSCLGHALQEPREFI
jgi:hypothetical protein